MLTEKQQIKLSNELMWLMDNPNLTDRDYRWLLYFFKLINQHDYENHKTS